MPKCETVKPWMPEERSGKHLVMKALEAKTRPHKAASDVRRAKAAAEARTRPHEAASEMRGPKAPAEASEMRRPKTSAKVATEMGRAEAHAAEVHPPAPEMHAASAKAPKATGYG